MEGSATGAWAGEDGGTGFGWKSGMSEVGETLRPAGIELGPIHKLNGENRKTLRTNLASVPATANRCTPP